jgi:hypothetical protein
MIPLSSTATMQKVSYRHQKICFQQEHPTITATFVVGSAYLRTVTENHSPHVKTFS